MSDSAADYVKFLFTANNKSYGFRTYDSIDGREVGFQIGLERDGRPIYYRWKFDQDGSRKISVHKKRHDKFNDQSAVDFLRNSPNCEGSPNGSYGLDGKQVNVYFKEVNEEKDAKVLVDEEVLRIEAMNVAVKLKGQDFVDVAALCGIINKDESVMRIGIIDRAKVTPGWFLELVNDKSRQARSLIRRAVASNVISRKGKLFEWEDVLLGVDEDAAVIKLISDEKLATAIKSQLEKVK